MKTALSILSLAVPLTLAQLAQVLISLTDTIMVGRLDSTALAAASLAGQFEAFLIVTFTALCQMTSVLVAREHTARGRIPAKLIDSSRILSLVLGCIAAALMMGLAPLVPHLGQPQSVATAVERYWFLSAASIVPAVVNSNNKMILDGAHAAGLATMSLFFMVGLNVLLNGVFMFGWFSGLSWGLDGAGLATLLSRMSGAVVTAILLNRFKAKWRPGTGKAESRGRSGADRENDSHRDWLKKLFALGLPIGLMSGAEFGAFSLVGVLSGHFGETALAAHRIGLQVTSITYLTATGIAQAASLRAMAYVDPDHHDHFQRIIYTGVALVMIWMSIWAAVILFFHGQMPSLFTQDGSVSAVAAQVLLVVGLYQLADGAQASGLASLRALHDTRVPGLVCVGCFWLIALPLGAALAYGLDWGLVGLWTGLLSGLVVLSVVAHVRLRLHLKSRLVPPLVGIDSHI